MGFLFDGLDAEEYDRQYGDGVLVRRILGYFRPQSRKMLLAAAMISATAVLEAAVPIFLARSLDGLAPDTPLGWIVLVALALAGLASTSWVFNLVRQTLSSQAVGDVVMQLRQDAADAVLRRDLSFYDQYPSGKIVSRVTSDTAAFSQVMVLTMDLLSRTLLVAVILGYLATIDLVLTGILLGLAPLIVAAALGFRRIARKTITASRRMNATVSAHVQETVSGIGVAKTFRQEPAIYAEFVKVNDQSRRVNMRTRYTFSSIFPILNMLAGVGTALLVYLGGRQVWANTLTTGEWFLFIQGLAAFWFPLTSIASFWSQFQLGLAAGERVFALIDAEPRVVQNASLKLPAIKGAIVFERVDFSYEARPKTKDQGRRSGSDLAPAVANPTLNAEAALVSGPSSFVLEDFSLRIAPGETVALVGHTGSGKSSIARLVARFYEFQGGRISVDGVDLRDLDLTDYRARLGIVTQSPFLFDGTVRENVRYGRPEAEDAAVLAAARRVGGGDWISTLPQGLDTPVGERGGNLSMGQRQLVALARVLLQDPSICILDEATASIDPLTETLIQEGLDEVLAGRTSIVIAHRLSTVRSADRIIVLRKGQIIEEGSHDRLMARGGHYAELYNTYFRHQSLAYIEGGRSAA